MKNIKPTIILLLATLLGFIASIFLQWNNLFILESHKSKIKEFSDANKRSYLMLLDRFPTLGYSNLLSDFIFLDFLGYFGDENIRQKTGFDLSPDYFRAVIHHDPHFYYAYIFLSTATSIYAGQPLETTEIMESGLSQASPKVPYQGYYLWRYLALDQLLFLGDTEKAIQSLDMAIKWANSYDTDEAQQFAQSSESMVAALRKNPANKAVQVNAWGIVLQNAIDPKTQELAIENIERLGGRLVQGQGGSYSIQLPSADE